jgi:hypothetical protein
MVLTLKAGNKKRPAFPFNRESRAWMILQLAVYRQSLVCLFNARNWRRRLPSTFRTCDQTGTLAAPSAGVAALVT